MNSNRRFEYNRSLTYTLDLNNLETYSLSTLIMLCLLQIRRLPGVEYSKEEQLEKLETLRKQLKLKRELLLKYRNMYTFDMPKSNYN